MKKPVAKLVGIKFYDSRGHWGNVDRMLQRGIFALTIENSEKVAVQVHGMVHHGAVDQLDLASSVSMKWGKSSSGFKSH